MVTITLSATGAKSAAVRLREFLAADGINLKQTHAYEALAQVLGYANWNTLQALLDDTPSLTENPPEKRLADKLAAPMVDARGHSYTAERLADQAAPRISISFDPKKFDKFAGFYQAGPSEKVGPSEFFTVTRKGDQLLVRHVLAQEPIEVFPESETKFFGLTHAPVQFTFNLNALGYAESMLIHQHGQEHFAKRVEEAVVTAFQEALQKYVADNKPSPQREVLLRRAIAASYGDTPNLEDIMAPWVVESTKRTWPTIHSTFLRLGKLQELKFLHVKRDGSDVYEVVFDNGSLIWEVGPLTSDHKLTHTWYDFP